MDSDWSTADSVPFDWTAAWRTWTYETISAIPKVAEAFSGDFYLINIQTFTVKALRHIG